MYLLFYYGYVYSIDAEIRVERNISGSEKDTKGISMNYMCIVPIVRNCNIQMTNIRQNYVFNIL